MKASVSFRFSARVRILVTELLFTEMIHLPDRCDVSRCAGTGVLYAVRMKGHTLCCVIKHFRVAFYCDGPKQVKGSFIRHFTKLDRKPHLRESMKMVYFVVLPWRCKSTLMLLKVLIAKCSKYEQESCRFKGAVCSSERIQTENLHIYNISEVIIQNVSVSEGTSCSQRTIRRKVAGSATHKQSTTV